MAPLSNDEHNGLEYLKAKIEAIDARTERIEKHFDQLPCGHQAKRVAKLQVWQLVQWTLTGLQLTGLAGLAVLIILKL